jgi:hypothetical protein
MDASSYGGDGRTSNAPTPSSDAGWSSSTAGGAARGNRHFFSPPPRQTTASAKLRRTRSGGPGEHGPQRRWIRGCRRRWHFPPSASSRRPRHGATVTDPSPTGHGCESEGGCGSGSSSCSQVRKQEQRRSRWRAAAPSPPRADATARRGSSGSSPAPRFLSIHGNLRRARRVVGDGTRVCGPAATSARPGRTGRR